MTIRYFYSHESAKEIHADEEVTYEDLIGVDWCSLSTHSWTNTDTITCVSMFRENV